MQTTIDLATGSLAGEVTTSERRIADLAALPQDTIVYRVQMHDKEAEGTPGGLLFGTSFVYPGKVGDEYFMTKGHFHAKRDTAEYYFCISGRGALILMDEEGNCWAEKMERPLHYLPRSVAHRLANTGEEVLAVGCCWGADCGHDYASIARTGFAKRLREVDGEPKLG